jgi:hypothetical protein
LTIYYVRRQGGDVRIDAVRAGMTASLLLAACSHVQDSKPAATVTAATAGSASLTKFDWAPPCRVPVIERRTEDFESRRFSYVVEVTRGPGDQLEVRRRDFKLLELNDEDMTAPGHAAEIPELIVLDALVPVIRVADDGAFVPGGPLEIERVVGELKLSPEQAAPLGAWASDARIGERAADVWRTWVGAWTPWTLAAGQAHDGTTQVTLHRGGTLTMSERREALGSQGPLLKLRVTEVLDAAGVKRKYADILRHWASDGLGTPPVMGDERVVRSVETDARTLRPVHARYESDLHSQNERFGSAGAQDMRKVVDTTFDWAHAEGCKR